MDITVYNISGSPMGWRVLLGLEFKGLAYTAKYLKGSEDEHKKEPYLGLNPHGKVPVLEYDGRHLRESLAILAWLDEEFPDHPLFGSTVADIRCVWQMTAQVSDYLLKATSNVVFPVFRGQDGAPDVKDGGMAELLRAALLLKVELRALDTSLVGGSFMHKDAPSAADAVAFPEVGRIMRALSTKPRSMAELGFGAFDQDFPNIARWRDRLIALPGHARTIPPHWSEA